MKNHAFFFRKDKSTKLKCHLLQFLFIALRVKHQYQMNPLCNSEIINQQKIITKCFMDKCYINDPGFKGCKNSSPYLTAFQV